MYFSERIKFAEKYGLEALKAMKAKQVPPYPTNYAVWYAYFNGKFADLKKEIDELIEDKAEFTDERNAELYDRFFGHDNESEALEESSRRLESVVSQLLGYLGKSKDDTESYGETLETYQDQLTETSSPEQIREVVGTLLAETKKMAERHQKLQAHVAKSSAEITDLREKVQSMRVEALTDPLTGIANRKCFDTRLTEAIAESGEDASPLCLLMLDIDYFKKFNDTYGHQLGDEVLKLVARTFVDSIKGQDTAARYGGEEFAIILPRTRLSDAATVADQIRKTMAAKVIVNRRSGEQMGNITLSIGVATYHKGELPGDFLRRADEALYAAKNAGRNRVVSEDRSSELVAVAS